jgi:tetratricopeptide (TPR) repeat protein
VLACAAACSKRAAAPPSAPAATFVGAARCAPCHARETAAWQGSHHQQAMQPAAAATVLGKFDGATFAHGGVESRFSRQGGKYVARTDGADGAVRDFEVTYTFGVAPLQQYLVSLSGGRAQALEIAWDSRPAAAGGQRWFHLYPNERITPGDPLHWTGRAESWNYMCADCHSTNVRKGYDTAANAYATSFAEVSVSCEACHGPGSEHVAWASSKGAREAGNHGLTIALDERAGVSWPRDVATGQPQRSTPRKTARELEMCARCHSRRGLVHEDHVHGQPLGDDYRVALLDDDLYYPDGQVKGEVYEYGSFLQSRMFAEGVTCTDCHDPHRPSVTAFSDGVCARCHDAATHATPKHHFHAQASAGARCVSCHMPTTTFMVVDGRHDHSFRVPRPDQTVALGVPNACNGCHAGKSPAWAARTVERWYGHAPQGFQRFAGALAAAAEGGATAEAQLSALAADRAQPAIARASAIARLAPGAPETIASAGRALSDGDALVRRAAVESLAAAPPPERARLLGPLLEDPVRTVRLEAAAATGDVPAELFSRAELRARDAATAELTASNALNGDEPEAHLNQATLLRGQRRFDLAEEELRHALALAPTFTPAAANLADLYRAQGRDAEGERVLRGALERAPDDPGLAHALGLALVREHRLADALPWLERAARARPDDARYGYVFAVALHDLGRRADGLRELERVLGRRPEDRATLEALAYFYEEAGDRARALRYGAMRVALDRPSGGASSAGQR